MTVLATRDGLRAWTVMLSVVAFSMSMIGTFLVRSGILTSVHAFAVDPTRGAFILVLLAIYIGGALALFGLRVGTVRAGNTFEPVSREGALVANNLLLTVILALVLIGTLYPIVAAGFGVQLSVGPPFFDKTIGPIALILAAIMAAGPLLRWRRDDGKAVLARMIAPAAITAITLVLFAAFGGGIGILPLFGLSLAAGLAAASVAPLWKRNLRRTPLFVYGMVVAHFGIAVSLAGMASDSAFTKETLVAAEIGKPYQCRSLHRDARQHRAARRVELVRARGQAQRAARRRRSADPPPAIALLRRSGDGDQRIRHRDPARRPALHRARPAGRAGALAIAAVVEAVRDVDLAGRRAGRAGRLVVADRPVVAGTARCEGRGMKRWLLWAPLLTFVLIIGVVAAGLFKPADRAVKSAMVGKPLPSFALRAIAADQARTRQRELS